MREWYREGKRIRKGGKRRGYVQGWGEGGSSMMTYSAEKYPLCTVFCLSGCLLVLLWCYTDKE